MVDFRVCDCPDIKPIVDALQQGRAPGFLEFPWESRNPLIGRYIYGLTRTGSLPKVFKWPNKGEYYAVSCVFVYRGVFAWRFLSLTEYPPHLESRAHNMDCGDYAERLRFQCRAARRCGIRRY